MAIFGKGPKNKLKLHTHTTTSFLPPIFLFLLSFLLSLLTLSLHLVSYAKLFKRASHCLFLQPLLLLLLLYAVTHNDVTTIMHVSEFCTAL